MSAKQSSGQAVFRVINAMDAPYYGRILRLRLQEGKAPSLRDLKGATLKARSPRGENRTLKVLGFPSVGGKPSDARLTRTGRVYLLVECEDTGDAPPVGNLWEVTGPV